MYLFSLLKDGVAVLFEVKPTDDENTFEFVRYVEAYPDFNVVEESIASGGMYSPIVLPSGKTILKNELRTTVIDVDNDDSAKLYVELNKEDLFLTEDILKQRQEEEYYEILTSLFQ